MAQRGATTGDRRDRDPAVIVDIHCQVEAVAGELDSTRDVYSSSLDAYQGSW